MKNKPNLNVYPMNENGTCSVILTIPANTELSKDEIKQGFEYDILNGGVIIIQSKEEKLFPNIDDVCIGYELDFSKTDFRFKNFDNEPRI